MSKDRGEPTGLQSWSDPGQNRESGGTSSESAPYATESESTSDGK